MKTKITLSILLFLSVIVIFAGVQDSRFFIGQVTLRDTLSGALKLDRLYAGDSIRIDGGGGIYVKGDSKIYSNTNELSISNKNSIIFHLDNTVGGNMNFTLNDTGGLIFNKSAIEYFSILPDWNNTGTESGYLKVSINGSEKYIRIYDTP